MCCLLCLRFRFLVEGLGILGIRREDKNRWERRAPLAPIHVKQLVREGVRVVVQPSNVRIATDFEYQEAGAEISEDLTPCNVILGGCFFFDFDLRHGCVSSRCEGSACFQASFGPHIHVFFAHHQRPGIQHAFARRLSRQEHSADGL